MSLQDSHREGKPIARWKARQTVHFFVGLAAIAAVLFWLQFSTADIGCVDFDGYYHIRWSRLLWEGLQNGSFPPQFTWLPLTTLNQSGYADQHFLYHLLLIPFTWFGDLRFGAKLAAALFATLAVLSCYWLVLRYRIPYPILWLLALLGCSYFFYYRMSMTRVPSLSIVLLVAGIGLLFEENYRWLAPLGFFYVWSYNLFVFLGVAVVFWVAAVWWVEDKFHWPALLWTGTGTVAGFVIHPYFPRNLLLFLEHLRIQAAHSRLPGGGEWFPWLSWPMSPWLVSRVPPGDLIFNVTWGTFPKLLYYDPSHRYVTGLDPAYLLDKNPDLARLYDRIVDGEEPDAAALVRTRFGARYVFVGTPSQEPEAVLFFTAAVRSAGFHQVFGNQNCAILEIRD